MKDKIDRIKSVAVFCGAKSACDASFDSAVVDFGRFLASHGITLVFGGSNVGTMKLLADTVVDEGGEVIGVFTTHLPQSLQYGRARKIIVTHSLAERKEEMRLLSDALVALPGSLGTLDELFDSLALRRVKHGGHKKPIGLLNTNGYYDKLIEFLEHSRDVGFSSNAAVQTLKVGRTPQELFKRLAGSLPPGPAIPAGREDNLNTLWHAMSQDTATYGCPEGAPFANAFYRKARSYPLSSWRKACYRIVDNMLMWVEDLDVDIVGNMDLEMIDEWEWVDIMRVNPDVLKYPNCPVDNICPISILQAISDDIGYLEYLDDDSFTKRLDLDDEDLDLCRDMAWFDSDVEKARQMGKPRFAEWLERLIASEEIEITER